MNTLTNQPPRPGDHVVYNDPSGQDRDALVTAYWGGPNPSGALNLVVVTSDPSMQDTYGRQIARASSVCHGSTQTAPGNYWRRPGEPRVEPTPPAT